MPFSQGRVHAAPVRGSRSLLIVDDEVEAVGDKDRNLQPILFLAAVLCLGVAATVVAYSDKVASMRIMWPVCMRVHACV